MDMRMHIVDRILAEGGDRLSGYIPVTYTFLSQQLSVSPNTVKNIWGRYCEDFNVTARSAGGSRNNKLNQDDLELIETLKVEKPSMSLAELVDVVSQHGGLQNGQISVSAISRAIRSGRLPTGQRYSWKKLTKLALERFTPDNILYTQLFVDYLSSKDPWKIKFFDEAGVKLPYVGSRSYGHSPLGMRCVEVVRKCESPNITLNLLASLNGPEYYNLINGPTNTVCFLEFFQEASEAVNILNARPCLEVGDIVVMDNLSSHHYEGGEILENWLHEMGIELLYTPSYSPDLNPVEFCFSKIKGQLNGSLQALVHTNIKLAIMEAVDTISIEDMKGYYEATSYLFV
jgi:transposase